MKRYGRLIVFLIVVGVFNSIVAYFVLGISGLRTSVEGWLIGLVAAIVLSLILRSFWENESPTTGWMTFAVVTVVVVSVVGGFAFHLSRGRVTEAVAAGLTIVAALVMLVFRLATIKSPH